MRFVFLIFTALLLTGCASNDYAQYAKTQEAIQVAKSNAEVARFNALATIAKEGDSASKVAAVMALALGGNAGGSQQTSTVAAPERNQALQWASILVPSVTQIYGIRANADVAMRSSDNATLTSIATTNGFVGLAARIQAPGATYTISGNSGASSGTSAVSGNSGSNSGTSAISGNSGDDSGNATSVPTVVNQPTPVIVTQPPPTVVNPVVVNQPPPIVVTPVTTP